MSPWLKSVLAALPTDWVSSLGVLGVSPSPRALHSWSARPARGPLNAKLGYSDDTNAVQALQLMFARCS